MKRGPFDVLRRGLDNAVANWGLIVIRLVELFVYVVIVIAGALAILAPILLSIGISLGQLTTPDEMEGALLTLLEKWVLLVWIFLAVSVLMLVMVAVHSVVAAGCARVAVDADRVAGPQLEGPRSRYHVFSMARFWAGAREGWWTVFWIYNIAWGLAGLILLIPLLPTLAMTLLFRESPAVAITAGCGGLAITMLLMIPLSIAAGIWTNRAIVDWAAQPVGARAALRGAWGAIKADLGRHVLVVVAMIVVAIAGSGLFASFSWFAAFADTMHETMIVNFFTIPLRLIGTLANWVFSSFVGSWSLAAFAALAVENTRRA
jgi:hypothetical protein